MKTWLPLLLAACLAAPLSAQEDDGGNPDASGAVSGKEAGISEGAKDNAAGGSQETKSGPGSGGGKECKKGPASEFKVRYGGGNHNFLSLTPGQAFFFPLRKDPVSGLVGGTRTTGTNGNMTVEWAVSRCPGDFEWYKKAGVPLKRPDPKERGGIKPGSALNTKMAYPCGGATGVESNGFAWTADSKVDGMSGQCPLSGEGPWYASVRSVGKCGGTKDCTIVFDVIEHVAAKK